MPRPPVIVDTSTVLLKLAGAQQGGTLLTDAIGRYAYRADYNGVRFPSARALALARSRPWAAGSLEDGLRYGTVSDDSFEFDDLLQEINAKAANLVIFRGSYILRCVTRFKVETADSPSGQWRDNEWYNVPEEEIERQVISAGGLCAEDVYSACDQFIQDFRIRWDKAR